MPLRSWRRPSIRQWWMDAKRWRLRSQRQRKKGAWNEKRPWLLAPKVEA
jgi:hypothetical protein